MISFFNYLINSTGYKEAKNTFLLVGKDDPPHFERAATNIANILEKYGRNYEALYAYEKAIKFYVQKDSLIRYASTLNNLGIVYVQLPPNDRKQNLHKG